VRFPAPPDWQLWSARRQNEFEACPRRFWYSCCAAPAGAQQDADLRLRQLYFCSRIVPRGVWLNLLVQRVVRELFYRPEPGREPLPGEALVNAFKHAFFQSWIEVWQFLADHPAHSLDRVEPWPPRIPLIPEELLDADAPDFETLRRELETELVTRAHLLANAAWLTLDTLPPHDRVPVSVPVTVPVNHLAARMSPVAAFRRQTEFWIVDGAEHHFDEAATVLLHKFFASKRFGTLPQFVHSLRIDPRSGRLRELLPELNVSAELKRLELFTRTLSGGVDPDGFIDSTSFPPNPASCRHCRYRTLCGGEKTF